MFNKWLVILFLAVLVAAGGLGAAVFYFNGQNAPQKKLAPIPRVTTEEQTPEEKQALNLPTAGSTEEDREAHSALIEKLANETEVAYLDISGCQGKPAVFKVKEGATFTVKNTDGVPRVMIHGAGLRTTIKAGSEETLESSAIGPKPGDYGYGCEGEDGTVGIIKIVP